MGKWDLCIPTWGKNRIEEGEAYARGSTILLSNKRFNEAEVWCRRDIIYHVNNPDCFAIFANSQEARRSHFARALKRLRKIYLEKHKPEKALECLKKAKQLGATGIKRYLKKAR